MCVLVHPALQLFPVSYHTALWVARLYVCVCVRVLVKSLPLSHFYHNLAMCLSHKEGREKKLIGGLGAGECVFLLRNLCVFFKEELKSAKE